MAKMLIVDDEYYIRKGIRETMDWESIDVEIIGEAEDGERALELIRTLHPDLMLMDIQMPFLNGLELMEVLHQEGLDVGVIVLSGHDDFEYAQRAIKNGVLDYILKPIESSVLKETVLRAAKELKRRRSHTAYAQMVQRDGGKLRTSYWRDVLLGTLNASAAQEKASELGIQLQNCNFQAIHIKLDEYDLLSKRLDAEAVVEVRAEIAQAAQKALCGEILEISPDSWAVVLGWPMDSPEPLLRQQVEAFFTSLQHLKYSVSLSASQPCTTLATLSDAFHQAWKDNRKFMPGKHSIVFAAELTEQGDLRTEVREAIGYIQKHFHEDITIQTVADKLYISSSHLMHLFKQDLGKTFNTCLPECRMEQAKKLLREPGSKVYQIAKQVGYNDVKHFNKLFKRYTSLSPKDFVRLNYAEL